MHGRLFPRQATARLPVCHCFSHVRRRGWRGARLFQVQAPRWSGFLSDAENLLLLGLELLFGDHALVLHGREFLYLNQLVIHAVGGRGRGRCGGGLLLRRQLRLLRLQIRYLLLLCRVLLGGRLLLLCRLLLLRRFFL